MRITASTLTENFGKGHRLQNRNGIVISMVNQVFTVTEIVEVLVDEGCVYELNDEVYSAENFIFLYDIHSLEDLKLLDLSSLWRRYLAESAEMIFTTGDGNSLC